MASEAYANDFESTLNGAIVSTVRPATFAIHDAVPAVLAGGNFRMRIDGEYWFITAVDGTGKNLTGSNVEGSAAATHANNAVVDQVLTRAGLFNSPGPMTAQGDLTYLDATLNPARLPVGSAGQVLGVASGLPAWVADPGGGGGGGTGPTNNESSRAYRNTALSLTGGSAWTKFPIDTNDYDPSTLQVLASNRFVAAVAGKYSFVGGIAKGDTTTRVQLAVYVNAVQRDLIADSIEGFVGGACTVDLAVNDQVELWYNANSTPAVTTGKYNAFAELTLLVGTAGIIVPQGPVTIPGFAGSPDIKTGGASDEEFEQNTAGVPAGWTSFGTAATSQDSNSIKSYFHQKQPATGGGDSWAGIYKAAPGLPFTMTAKINYMRLPANNPSVAIFVGDATPPVALVLARLFANVSAFPHGRADYFSNLTTFSASAGDTTFDLPIHYFRLVVHSATNIDVAFSEDGITWYTATTAFNHLASIASVGVALDANGGLIDAAIDWIRFS